MSNANRILGVEVRTLLESFENDLQDSGVFCLAAAAYYEKNQSTTALVSVIQWRAKLEAMINRLDAADNS